MLGWMTMRTMALAVVLLTGCANAHVNRATLVASTAALVLDWKQTRTWAEHDWTLPAVTGAPWVGHERNPILGQHPQTGAVDAYFMITAIMNVGLWLAMPDKYKSVVPTALLGMEASAIHGNIAIAAPIRDAPWMWHAAGF